MELPRVPVSRAANPSQQRSASSPEPSRTSSEYDSSGESRRSEPGPAECSQFKDDTLPLQEIREIVKRVQARHEKLEKDRKKESARKSQQKKKKAQDAKDKLDKLSEQRKSTSAIICALEAEVEEVGKSAYAATLGLLLGKYFSMEIALAKETLENVLVANPDVSAKPSVALGLDKLEADIVGDANLARSPDLKNLHMRRAAMIRSVLNS
ncbi:hypothetical protein HRG_001163 [Hirsutella rhossiliensis]|uniref:Uncharacterized protein n=1 Tax=Hirsutella rhossiliensis TaxID=111463 RepID=A0A9P8SMZ2_9HYPO|nr:uncharacterized protein HRG_01163 [Hirsutella rhossiliensis]KAH0968521.1 hypothetical protein HRG_01163 [Hirsutella rhossiliensis]